MTTKSSTAWIKACATAAVMLAPVVLGACAAGETTASNPILRKFQWFSYLEGGDFKEICAPGQPARYRMVYNAIYTDQVRVYDFAPDAGRLDVRVILPMDMRDFYVEGVADLLNPWRGTTASRTLDARQAETLIAALDADGVFGPPAVGTQLPSVGFFWTVAACHDGQYSFTGFTWPSQTWGKMHFDDVLFALDPVSVPVAEPRTTRLTRTPDRGKQTGGEGENEFILEVGENGLASFEPLF